MSKASQIVASLEKQAHNTSISMAAQIVGKYRAIVAINTRRTKTGSFPVTQYKFGGKVCSRKDMIVNVEWALKQVEVTYEFSLLKDTWTPVALEHLDRLIVDLCGGGYTQAQTTKSMRMRNYLNGHGIVVINNFTIRRAS